MSRREVHSKNSKNVFRVEIVQGHRLFSKRPRWRYRVERRWGAIPDYLAGKHHWSHWSNGRWRSSPEAATADGTAWLDAVEAEANDRTFIEEN